MNMKRSLSIAASLCGLAVLAGCGDSDIYQYSPEADASIVAALRKGGSEQAAPTGAETEAVATGTGWGTITGTFVFDGSPPAPKTVPTGGKDAPTCNPNGVPDESLVVDPQTKGIKNILIYARKVSRVNDSYKEHESDEVVFDQKDCVFLNHVQPLTVSQTLLLKNSEASVGHNTAISPPADKGANPLLPPNSSDRFKFSKQQNSPVPVSCSIHPWMKAYVIPRENPYFAVTDAQGAFKIADVPAGEEVEFQLWQENSAGPQGALVVPGLTDNKGRFTKKVEDGQTLELGTLKVPATDFRS